MRNPEAVNWLNVLKIAGAFVAFIIGSGFATGQESMQFFAAYGFRGILGSIVAAVALVYACWSLMLSGRNHGLTRNEDVFRHYCGTHIGVFLTWYTMVFIIAVHAIMLAGAGAVLNQAYGVPTLLGSVVMALISMTTLLLGLNKILDVMGLVGPLIILLTIVVALLTLYEHSPALAAGNEMVPDLQILKASPHWLFSAMLYAGLIMPGLASFMPAVGATAGNDREVAYPSVLGPLLLMGAMILVVLAMLTSIEQTYQAEVPVLVLAANALPVYGAIFAVIIFLGIYTTATPLLWTVCARFSEEATLKYKVLVVCLTLVGLVGGTLLPFGKLVNLIYPTVGYAGLLFLLCAVITDTRSLLRSRDQ